MWMLSCSTNQTRMTPSLISKQVGENFFDSDNKLPNSLCSQGNKLLITFDGCSSIRANQSICVKDQPTLSALSLLLLPPKLYTKCVLLKKQKKSKLKSYKYFRLFALQILNFFDTIYWRSVLFKKI